MGFKFSRFLFFLILLSITIFAVADSYEDDDTSGTATTILVDGTIQHHTFDPAGDADWYVFTAATTSKYLIATNNLSGGADTIIRLYKSDASTLFGYNDDVSYGINLSSAVLFVPIENGTYYLKLTDYSSSSGVGYDIYVKKLGQLQAYVLSPNISTLFNQSLTFNFSAGVTCVNGNCSGITATLDPKEEEKYVVKTDSEIMSDIGEKGSSQVIVNIKEGFDANDVIADVKGKKDKSNKDLSDYKAKNIGSKKTWFSSDITNDTLDILLNDPRVESIIYDREVKLLLDSSIPLINATQVWSQTVNNIPINGTGTTVCIIDTGINYNHAAISGAYLGGYDYVNDDTNPADDHGHGSHVAGIVASRDSTYRGVAPGAKVIAIKVLDSAGNGYTSDIISGVEWCTNNASLYNISVISMSLGYEAIPQSVSCNTDSLASSITSAIAANITVVVASGNDYYGYTSSTLQAISSPSCIPGVISVGSTTKSDAFSSFGNRAMILTLVAPGSSITSADYDGTFVSMSGTSMATPHVAGLAALTHQLWNLTYNRSLNASQTTNLIKYSGTRLLDSSGSSLYFYRINSYSASTAKGVVPMNRGQPFYTITQNPSASFNLAENESMNLTWNVTVNYTSGTYAFFVVFEDPYGDYNLSSSVNITIRDSVAPSITISSPANTTYNSTNTSIQLSSSSSDADTIWFYNGTANETYTTSVYRTFSEGNNTLLVWANDTSGNTNSTNVSFTIDITAPNITSIQNVSIYNVTALGVQFTATDNLSVNWSVNDTTNFAINSSGYLSNATTLSPAVYYLNASAFDSVGNTASRLIWVNVTALHINSISLSASQIYNGTTVQIYINASNPNVTWTNITLPNNSIVNLSLTNLANTSFSNTNLTGTYNLVFFINGTGNELVNTTSSFVAFSSTTFVVNVTNYNSSGINSSLNVSSNTTLVTANTSATGNFSVSVFDTNVTLLFSAYSNRIRVTINSINASSEANKTFGIDNSSAPSGYLGAYAINNNYTFSNATVLIYYDDLSYDNEASLKLSLCADWNFTNRTCSGTWADITSNSTLNTTLDNFSYNTTSFSGFAISQGPYCGDSSCNNGESCSSCSTDCGACAAGGSGSGSGGGGGGGGGGGSSSGSSKKNTTLEHVESNLLSCINDDSCSFDSVCINGECKTLSGSCGYAENHIWTYYECCSDDVCPQNYYCKENICIQNYSVPVIKTVNQTQNVSTNVTISQDRCCLFGVCELAGVEEIAGSCWYTPFLLFIFIVFVLVLYLILKPKKPGKKEVQKQDKKQSKKKTKKPLTTFFLFLLFFVSFFHSTNSLVHPLSSSSLTSKDGVSTFRFEIRNIYNSSTTPFRVSISSNLSWFDTGLFDYSVQPDGYLKNNSPYWDLPPLFPNESMELSFTINKKVGRPDKIEVTTESIDTWSNGCNSLLPIENTSYSLAFPDNTTIYYSKTINTNKTFLVHLDYYNVFAVFVAKPQSSEVYLSSDVSIIKNVISSYVNLSASKVVAPKIDLRLFSRSIIKGNQSKNESEFDCLALTGMDRYPCSDRESCRYACKSVNVCSQVAQGWDFIDTIYDYNQTRTDVNSQIDKSFDDASSFISSPSYYNTKKALDSLIQLNTVETELIYHGMFTSYGFCSSPDFSLPSQIEVKRQLITYLDSYCVYGEEDRIVNESLTAASKLSSLINKKPLDFSLANSTAAPVNISTLELENKSVNSSFSSAPENLNPTSPSACCFAGICEIGGVETVYNICWEWWVVGIILLLLVFFLSILTHHVVRKI